MKILLTCAGGMSSSLLAQSLTNEAKKNGVDDFSVEATGTENLPLTLQKETYSAVLLAPQVAYRKDFVEKETAAYGIPVIPIEGTMYTPMGAPALLKKILEQVKA